MKRTTTVGVLVVAAAAVAAGAYLQWWQGPSFEQQFGALRNQDFAVNTAFTLENVHADSVEEATEAGRGTVRATFDGRDQTNVMTFRLFADAERAQAAFATSKTAAVTQVDIEPGEFFDSRGGFCDRSGPTFRCAVRWDALVIEGRATGTPDQEPDDVLFDAQGFVQAGVKGWVSVQLNLERGSYPFVWALLVSGLLLLSLALWRALSPPGRPATV